MRVSSTAFYPGRERKRPTATKPLRARSRDRKLYVSVYALHTGNEKQDFLGIKGATLAGCGKSARVRGLGVDQIGRSTATVSVGCNKLTTPCAGGHSGTQTLTFGQTSSRIEFDLQFNVEECGYINGIGFSHRLTGGAIGHSLEFLGTKWDPKACEAVPDE